MTLVDTRASSEERAFRVPGLSFPWQGGTKQVALSQAALPMLEERARRLLGSGVAQVVLDARILRGLAGWDAQLLSEQAFAEVELEVRAFTASRGALLAVAGGHATVQQAAPDIDASAPLSLFDLALVRAFEEAITRPLFVQLVNRALCSLREAPCFQAGTTASGTSLARVEGAGSGAGTFPGDCALAPRLVSETCVPRARVGRAPDASNRAVPGAACVCPASSDTVLNRR